MPAYRELRLLSVAEAAYLAGLIDGEGTVTLSRKHAGDMRQLAVSISNTELPILELALLSVGAGKLTRKATTKASHSPSYTYAVWNRHALALLAQIEPYMTSYKRKRARLALADYVRLTPRNGKYTELMRVEREAFENLMLSLTWTFRYWYFVLQPSRSRTPSQSGIFSDLPSTRIRADRFDARIPSSFEGYGLWVLLHLTARSLHAD